MINVHDEEFSKIAQDIKERFLGQVAFPKLIIGTGLSLMYDLPGMAALANRLNDFISQELALKDEWEKIYEDVCKSGLESALYRDVSPNLLHRIKIITSAYILESEKKKLFSIFDKETGFTTLLKHLKNSLSENNPYIDIMTPNYDRIIEVCCDKVGLSVVTGYTGFIYKKNDFNKMIKKNKFNNHEKFVRLFKPHGSINIISKNNECIECNDFSFLEENVDKIQIITPGKSKYKSSLTNMVYARPRESFDNILRNDKNYSLITFGYGFNDEHFNKPLFEALDNNSKGMLIISYLVQDNIIQQALTNSKIVVFCNNKERSTLIYNKTEYQLTENLSDINNLFKLIL